MPRQIAFAVVDAFTDTPFQGNPAGVFFDPEASLTADEMQRLAGEVWLESAFVLPGDGPFRHRLRYFTGVTEVPLCGHATVAAVTALLAGADESGLSEPLSFQVQTPPGPLAITVHPSGISGSPFVTLGQKAPEFGRTFTGDDAAALAEPLRVRADALVGDALPPQVVSTGTPWLLVPVRDRAAVDQAERDFAGIQAVSEAHGVFGFYVFHVEREADDAPSIWSRCFAPVAGLNEDPVTGSASGALGAFLVERGVLTAEEGGAPGEVVSRQGFAGGRGGTAYISVFRQSGKLRPCVRGTAVVIAEGVFTLL